MTFLERADESELEQLTRIARRYHALASDHGTIIWVMDTAMHPTGPNRGWERYTGQAPVEYAAAGWLEAIHPDDRARCQESMVDAQRRGAPVTIELAIRRHDGIFRRHMIRAVPVCGEGGSVVEWIGTAIDVEEARHTADELRDAEERLALANVAAGIGTWDWLLNVGDLRWSPELYQLVGERPGTMARSFEAWMERIHPDDRQEVLKRWNESLAQSDSHSDEFRIVRPDGEVRWLSTRATIFRDAAGAPQRVVGLAMDVTDHRQIQQQMAAALAQQRQLRQEAEHHSRQMAFLADVSTHLSTLDYEDTLRQVARLAVPHLADWCAVDLMTAGGELQRLAVAHVDPDKVALAHELHRRYPVHADDRGVPEVVRSGTAQHHQVITDEMLASAAHDAEHLALLRRVGLQSVLIVPLSARGRTFGAITFVSATGGRHFDEDDLAFATDLGRRAALAVDNARLFEEAQQANRAKDEFFALLSHELRTPLNAIVGWSQILLSERQPENALKRGLEVIARNARVQMRLVEDLFDVARLAGGRVQLRVADVDLREVVRTAVETARPAAVQRDLSLNLALPSSPCVARIDAMRLEQVLANLLSNALKFTGPGGEIHVSLRTTDQGGEIEVRDTGIGIAPDFLPHVFERLRQADSSPSRSHGGLGLGLWIVRQLVEAHGGTVHAQSADPGQGAVFTIDLPRG